MTQDAERLNQLLIQFEALVHKTMVRLNIQQHNMFYEDFTQELQLQLIEIYHSFEGNPLELEIDRYKFTAYAGQGLYWHGLNLLRQDNLDTVHTPKEEQLDWLLEQEANPNQKSTTTLYIEDFLAQAKSRLSDEDYLLLLYLVDGKYTLNELAKLLAVSRDTLYQRRKKIQTRLQDLKGCLMN